MTEDDKVDFALRCHPLNWLVSADRLHEAAKTLRKHRRTKVSKRDAAGSGSWFDGENTSCFLLAGFAAENVIKGFLVYEQPSLVANGKLARALLSHNLVSLAKRSNELPKLVYQERVLRALSDGLSTWSRYPVGCEVGDSSSEHEMSDGLWEDYLGFASESGQRLLTLLGALWTPAHGEPGRIEHKGEAYMVRDA